MIQIDRITTFDRVRQADRKQVEALAESIREVGLLNPIAVAPDGEGYALIAGMHRLEAARLLGWTEIPATVLALDQHRRIIAECDENLCAPSLTPAERAEFTRRRKAAYEALHPETVREATLKRGENLPSRQVGETGPAPRFTADTAAATGQSERAVQRDAERGEKVSDEALALIKGTRAAMLSTAAMRGFTAALVANPVGAALVGIMAVSAGIMGLASAARKAQDNIETFDAAMAESNRVLAEAREHTDKAAASTKSIGDKSAQAVAGVMGLCDATGKLADETFRLADAQAEAARTAILDRIAKNRVEIADRSAPGLWTRVGEAAGMKYTDGPHKGRYAKDVREEQIKALEQQNAGLMAASIEMGLADGAKWTNRPRATSASTESDPKKPKKASGPTPAELAAQRQMLDLQAEIELLRAQGQRVAADAKQDQLDTLNLTEQYEKAGFANAKAKAEAHVQALATAREANRVAEEAAELAEGEARAARLTNDFMLDMLDTQEQLALTDRDALDIRRQILAIRQAERRAALEAAAADKEATEAERAAARGALANLPKLERNESRALDGSTEGARDVKGIVADLRAPENAVERAREAYAEIDRLRQEDVISEQEAALAKAQIDADLREQRLAGTQTMLGALATLQNSSNKKLAALGKAAAIAQATIDGVLAVQKALASAPPPMNFIQAAVVGAVAAANVASIAGMADGGLVRGPGGPREDKVLRRLSNGEFVVNAKATAQNRSLLEAMNNGQRVPGLASGGLVGRADAAAASLGSVRSSSSSSFSYSPTIDARGADLAAIERLRQVMDEDRASFAERVNGVREKRARYRLGGRK